MTEIISNRQLVEMLLMMRTSVIISFLPVLTVGSALQDGWAAALISGLLFILAAWLIGGLGARYPRLTVVEYSRTLLGGFLGTVVSLIISWHFMLIAATDIRIYAELIRAAFMPNTPIVFTTALIASVVTCTAWLGLEPIGRTADVFFPLFAAFVILTLLGSVGLVDVRNLQPALARGIEPILSSIWTTLSIGLQWVILGMILPSTTAPRKAVGGAMLAAAISSIALAVVVTVVVGVLGTEFGRQSLFPFLKMARSVKPTRTIERIEALGVMAWGFGLAITGSTMVYCGSRSLAQIFAVANWRRLTPFFGAGVGIYSIIAYRDVFELLAFFRPPGFPLLAAGTFGVPYALMWIVHLAKRRISETPQR